MITLLRRERALLSLVVLAIAIAAFMSACGGDDDAGSSSQNDSSAQGDTSGKGKTYTVGIDIPFHPIFDYVKGKSDEYFGDKPYNVNFKFLDATTQVPSFGKGELDVMTTPPSFIPRVESQYGLKLAEFFPLARWTIGPQILVPSDSPYKTLEDLKGKKLAIAPLKTRFGSEEASILAATGENIRDYFDLQETDAAAQQLTLGRVDAAFIEAPSTYPLLEGGKHKPIWSVADGFKECCNDPAVVNGGYIAQRDFIKLNKDFVEDLIAATQDAWNKYNEDPDAVNEVASEVSNIPPEQLAVVGKVLDLNKIPKSERIITQRDVETWSKLFPLLEQSGFIEKAPDNPADLFVVGGQIEP
jgi:ABC-type nitrate/sulfonate/bicarbonate transport system substrate-binding protein